MTRTAATAEAARQWCTLVRNQAAIITSADEAVTAVLGWRPDELVGRPSTNLIHEDDQPSAIAAWFEMVQNPGTSVTWKGRYRTADGGWQWMSATNTNRLDDPDEPRVISEMTPIDVVIDDVAEELRARKQLLSRLADAVPVGLLQFDRDGRVTFTNQQLHELLGVEPATTVDAQLATVLAEDRPAVSAAIDAALADEVVAPVELRVRDRAQDEDTPPRTCELSLRPLTDSVGAVNGAIACLSDVTASVQLRRDLQMRASTDSLTGCLNRSATLEFLDLAIEQSLRHGSGVAVLYLDVDTFKDVNDAHGHTAGDAVLTALVGRIRATIRDADEVGRVGGDEFVVVCPNVPSRSVATLIAKRVGDAAHGETTVNGSQIGWDASLGMSWANEPLAARSLVADADRQMYDTKRQGSGAQRLARP